MTQPPITRILVLTADAGFGHRRAAVAVAQACKELYGEACWIEVANLLDDPRVLSLLRNTQSDHNEFARGLRDIYEVIWQASRSKLPSALLGGALTAALSRVLRDLIQRFQPHVIANTYPLYHPPLASFLKSAQERLPVVTIITDFGSVHTLWYYRSAAACLVATDKVRQQAISFGLSPENVHVCGIPISPAFSKETRSKDVIRASLGWQSGLPAALAVGSVRVPHMADILRQINSSDVPIQLAVVAGGDAGLLEELQRIPWRLPVHIYDWVEDMPALLHAADFVISKAGGLIISESLACGLPLLLVDVMPDQEKGNVEYLLQAQAGELGLGPGEAVSIIRSWLDGGAELLAIRARNAQAAGHPDAAYSAARLVWQHAQSEA